MPVGGAETLSREIKEELTKRHFRKCKDEGLKWISGECFLSRGNSPCKGLEG